MNELERILAYKIKQFKNNNFGVKIFNEDRFELYTKRARFVKVYSKPTQSVFRRLKRLVKSFIPNWILDLELNYEIFIGHFTIHSEEVIFFAKPINKTE